jgi:predicted aspartyl protease
MTRFTHNCASVYPKPQMTLKRANMKGFSDMGLTRIAITVRKLGSQEGGSYTATFLLDTGAIDSLVPASELRKLGIEPTRTELYEMASGQLERFEVGFAEFTFLGKEIPAQVMFGADDAEPILGVIALEQAGFIVDPVAERLKQLPARSLKAVALKSVA